MTDTVFGNLTHIKKDDGDEINAPADYSVKFER